MFQLTGFNFSFTILCSSAPCALRLRIESGRNRKIISPSLEWLRKDNKLRSAGSVQTEGIHFFPAANPQAPKMIESCFSWRGLQEMKKQTREWKRWNSWLLPIQHPTINTLSFLFRVFLTTTPKGRSSAYRASTSYSLDGESEFPGVQLWRFPRPP